MIFKIIILLFIFVPLLVILLKIKLSEKRELNNQTVIEDSLYLKDEIWKEVNSLNKLLGERFLNPDILDDYDCN